MFGWASRLVGKRPDAPRRDRPQRRSSVTARYDAAQHSDNSRRHWAAADGLSAKAANSPAVRRTLRNRSRYEVANNSYARGIVTTLANDVIGTGPRLQMLGGNESDKRFLEQEFAAWAIAIDLPNKLRTMRMARCQDGESFAVLMTNPALSSRVHLDLRVIEADQITTPDPRHAGDPGIVDGIRFDAFGNPIEYHQLRSHPGDGLAAGLSAGLLDYQRLPATVVIHDFRSERPGQVRGIPELTAALPLFALLRDYTLATLDAAKAAAYFAGILYTDAPAGGEADAVEPMDSIELERNTLLTMPGGWKLGQVKAEQPASTYGEFKREVLNEIARCLQMPFNVAAGNSSGYNYASGRLDHQTYFKAMRVDQDQIGRSILDRIFGAWFREAVLIEGYLPQRLRVVDVDLTHQWFWDGNDHVDPQKEAAAQATRLAAHTTTLADEYAKQGKDWEAQMRQRARELALMQELGLSTATPPPAADHEDNSEANNQETNDDAPAASPEKEDAASHA
jgi:lambda family phage portal protein